MFPRDGLGPMRRSRVGSTGPPPTFFWPLPSGARTSSRLPGRTLLLGANGRSRSCRNFFANDLGRGERRSPQSRVKFVKSDERLWPPPPGPTPDLRRDAESKARGVRTSSLNSDYGHACLRLTRGC